MQITWKQHRESEDKKRRGGSEYRRSVRLCLHASMSQMENRGCRGREMWAVSTGPRTVHSNYMTNNYIMLISCGWSAEFDGLNTRLQKVCRDRRQGVGKASENGPGEVWSPVLFYLWLESEKWAFIHQWVSLMLSVSIWIGFTFIFNHLNSVRK